MTLLKRFQFFLWYFGHCKVPLIGYLRPKLIHLDDKLVVICLPLSRRSKNHLKSMYLGALTVGADLAGGMHAFYFAHQLGWKISFAFKSAEVSFLKRPEHDVYFVAEEGEMVKAMLEESKTTGNRINKKIPVKAVVNYLHQPEEVAHFVMEISVKVKTS